MHYTLSIYSVQYYEAQVEADSEEQAEELALSLNEITDPRIRHRGGEVTVEDIKLS